MVVEGQTVNVCRCEHGEEITLGYGKGLISLERDTSNTEKFYTRLFPIGSSRNIDAEKYGSPRLMLPGKKKYVEVGVDEYGIYDHYEQAAFSGIYPRRVGTVSSVRSEEVKDEEGKTFTVYYFKDGGWISILTITSWPVRRNAFPSRAATFPGWGRGTTIISR